MFLFNSIRLATVRLSLATAMYISGMSYADDSVYKDSSTKLMWMRCSIGQTWTGNDCTGTPITLTWQDAMDYPSLFNQEGFAGKNNWRLPTISELSTLRRCSNGWAHEIKTIGNLTKDMGIQMVSIPNGSGTKQVPKYCADGSSSPTLDTNIFPNTKDDNYYWSSSPYAGNSGGAWRVHFDCGCDGNASGNYNYYVRLVRSSQ